MKQIRERSRGSNSKAGKVTYRKACRRSHRLLAAYLALCAWAKGVDCVILDRSELLVYLGLERMKNKRIDWFMADVQTLFPFAESLDGEKTKNAALYLSRFGFPEEIFSWMTDQERIEKMEEAGLLAAIVKIPTEAAILGNLASVIHGLKAFEAVE